MCSVRKGARATVTTFRLASCAAEGRNAALASAPEGAGVCVWPAAWIVDPRPAAVINHMACAAALPTLRYMRDFPPTLNRPHQRAGRRLDVPADSTQSRRQTV